jgi:thiamine kinase-like enzyme
MQADFFKLSEISVLRRDWDAKRTEEYIRALPVWAGNVQISQKFGGLQNRTYFVTDADSKRYAVRCGFDQYRTRQTSVVHCTIAAAKLGLGPNLRYAEPNVVITDFVDGAKMQFDQLKRPAMMAHVIERLKMLHTGSEALEESVSYWSPFHTIRRYLNEMEKGKEATGHQPSEWSHEVPQLRDITTRLERAIGPFTPVFTHNDLGAPNMIFNPAGEVWFIDWDGGGYGHPMWDVAEMLMWLESDEEMDRYALTCYHGPIEEWRMATLLREHRAFKIMASMRLLTEVMVTLLDPYYYLTPDEMGKSMAEFFPGQQARLEGLLDLIRPNFDKSWQQYAGEYL